MRTTVESIVEGTWASGAPPAEFTDYFLMHEMGWSWVELEATPPYVKRYCYDFRQLILAHEAEENERARRDAKRQ